MKFYTYIEETIKKNLSHQSFQFFLRLWNLNEIISKCSLVHYGMIIFIVDDYDFSKLIFFFVQDLLGLSVTLIIS
jgi:hypothetical protein